MKNKISQNIFRAYDIRGIVDDDLTTDVVTLIGKALAAEALLRGEKDIVIACDGRLSGPRLLNALSEGLLTGGINVIDIGAVPTPLLYYATKSMPPCNSGVMVTGSHNPPNYNGIKMVLAGETLAEQAIQKLYQRIVANDFANVTSRGTYKKINLLEKYITDICDNVKIKKKLNIVVDCGNGIGGILAQSLFSRLGCKVHELFCEVDGNFPNHHPDPSEPKNMQDLIAEVGRVKADVGIAFDGDADRLGVVTNEGEMIYPDRTLMLFAESILQQHVGGKVVYDVKCSQDLEQVIRANHGIPMMCKTGHSLMKQKVRQEKAVLGGEFSGHIIVNDRWNGFDDAIYAAARLLEILSQRDQTSAEIFRGFPKSISTPEIRIAIDDQAKFVFMEKFIREAVFPKEATINTLDGARVTYGDAWGLIRVSNTSPYLILRFEGKDQKSLAVIQKIFREQILTINSQLSVPF